MNSDHRYMARALQLAERGRYSTQPNPRVGCVIVKDDHIIGEGFHQRAGAPHAEVHALEQAGGAVKGSDIYITLEPCSHQGRTPACADALVQAQPKRVVMAMTDPNPLVSGKGLARLQAAGIKTLVGVNEQAATQLNRGFIKRMLTGKPFVTLKSATSLDGRIAMRSGESAWITSSAARREVHRMRLESCAVVTGINTVLVDDPQFTVRLEPGDIDAEYYQTARQPIRVVLDRRARLSKAAAICKHKGETWHITAEGSNAPLNNAADRSIQLALENQQIDLHALQSYLGEQEINNVLIEAGGTLAASFIRAGLVDEWVVFQSPDIMGASAQPMLNIAEIQEMNKIIRFEYQDLRKIGRDLKLVLTANQNA